MDFLLNLWRAPGRADYFFKDGGWLDLLGSIPAVPGMYWTALLRPARLNRLVWTAKHLRRRDRDEVIEEAREAPAKTALLTVVLIAIVLITATSLLILRFEQWAADAEITKGADAFWWAFVTITTVGYGDFTPVTFPGRVLAVVLMTFGIGVFAVLTSFMAAKLAVLQDAGRHPAGGHLDGLAAWEDIVATVREENAIIRAELAELRELLGQQTLD
jgi:voltage-gated potassium channel